MNIEITIDGVTRNYQGDYDELHNRDWNERVRALLDDVKDYEEEVRADRAKDHSDDEKI